MLKKKKELNLNPNYRIITKEDPLSLSAEAYRRIKVDLLFADTNKEIKVIQVCSSLKGEGKTTTALNIAETYAEDNKKVLIVDLDLRSPKLHRSFNVQNKDGFIDFFAGNLKLENAIKYNENYRFSLLNSGSSTIYPTTILGSKKIEELFIRLREMFDIIIVDCPPILAVSDAIIISKLCDGCLFIVSQQKTDKNAAKEAIKILKKNNVNLFGIVYTEIKFEGTSYSKNYNYYRDYQENAGE